MKKIWITFIALAVAASLQSCGKEEPVDQDGGKTEIPADPEDDKNDPEPAPVVTYSVTASLEDVADGLLTWTDGDALTAWSVAKDGSYGYNDFSERDLVAASVDGAKATFNFKTLPQGGKTWLAFMSNSGYDGCSAMKVEFNYKSNYTQAKAGEPDKSMVKLLSDEVTIGEYAPAADTTVALDARMRLVGTLLKHVVTSASYQDEKVVSIKLVSEQNMIAGLESAAMAYNLTDGGKYWLDNSGTLFGNECALIWDNTSKSIMTTVIEPAAISEAKAVFMPVPPVKVGGYKYVVTTDIAIYTLDFSSEDLTFGENQVRELVLDLDGGAVKKRLEIASIKGELMYEGSIPEAVEVSYTGGSAGIGYWYARTKDTGADWTTRENKDGNEGFYSNVRFEVVDEATGAPADWVSIVYRNGDTWWDYTVQPNSVEQARSAVVTAYFDDVDGYLIGEEYLVKKTRIVQEAFSNISKIDFWGGVAAITIEPAAGTTGWSWWVMTVNDANAETWSDPETQKLYKAGKFVCYDYTGDVKGDVVDWLTVAYRTDGDGNVSNTWWDITASENNTKAERKALVEFTMSAPEGYSFANGSVEYVKAEVVTQKANIDITASFENLLTEKISNAGAASVAAAKLSLSVDGQAVADVAAALTQYNVTLSATGGANVDAVAADGTVTMTFPANAPAKERTYELSAMFNGSAKATASFVQEAGTSDVALFTYTFGAWQSKGQYTVQFNASQFDHKHWLAVFNDLKYLGETPAALSADDEKALIMQLLGLNEEQYAAQPFIFTVEFGGAGETKVLIGIKEANTSGQMLVYNGTVYDADGNPYTTYTVNHLAN